LIFGFDRGEWAWILSVRSTEEKRRGDTYRVVDKFSRLELSHAYFVLPFLIKQGAEH
jgi:hypothetical protein